MANTSRDPIINKAAQVYGGISAAARALGFSRQAVWQWKRVPPEHVLKIERDTGISRHKLRPDIFGPAPRKNGSK